MVIITSVWPPDVSGTGAHFALVAETFKKRAQDVCVLRRPTLFETLRAVQPDDIVLTYATPRTVFPALAAQWFRGCALMVRIGGDFFWERAVERGAFFGTLRNFYKKYSNPERREGLKTKNWKLKTIFWLMGFALRKADALVFTSALLRDIYVPLFQLDAKKVHTITNPMPACSLKVQGTRYKVQGSVRLIYAGRFIKLKNLSLLLRVFAQARKQHPALALTLVGEGPEEAKLKAESEKLKIGNAVVFKSPMSHERMLAEMTQSDLVVLPSLSEVSPNVLLDALSVGVPMLATRENGLCEHISQAGAWFDPMSEADFAEKLDEALVPGALQRMREKITHVPYRKTMEEVAEEYEHIFLSLRR